MERVGEQSHLSGSLNEVQTVICCSGDFDCVRCEKWCQCVSWDWNVWWYELKCFWGSQHFKTEKKTSKQTKNNSISLLYLFAPKYSTYRLPSGLCEWASFVSLCGDYKLFGWFLQIWQLPFISDVFGKWLDLLKRAKKSFNWCSLYMFCHCSLFLYLSFVAL